VSDRTTTLTIEGVLAYLREVVAEGRLAGNSVSLRDAQRVAGFLMLAAEQAGDRAAARSFHLLAAEAANRQEAGDEGSARGRVMREPT
jgi:hypothetical protein